ncbi:MAG: AmmeMemoRadiSam system protein B [Candidatus Acidifodinimicrobium sp.]
MREMAFSGSFYPESRTKILNFISAGQNKIKEEVKYSSLIGLIVPHAGYQYSGLTAISAYKQLKGEIKRFILIGPCHDCMYGTVYLDDNDSWDSPFGPVKVDKEIVHELGEYDNFKISNEQHAKEHSLEVQIPFLKYFVKNDFSIVPIILADQSKATVAMIAEVLKNYIDGTVIIISSDFNHYEPSNITYKKDMDLIERISSLDIDGFYNVIEKENITACGYGGIAILMLLTKFLSGKIELIRHDDSSSGGTSGKFVVGYASMVSLKK